MTGIDKTDKSVIIAMRGKLCTDDAVAQKIAEHVQSSFPELEYYEFDGGQDVYAYIFVVE